jgi:hypothetical protein
MRNAGNEPTNLRVELVVGCATTEKTVWVPARTTLPTISYAASKCSRDFIGGLTLELSGGAAVRLNEELGACAAPCLGDCAGATANPAKRNASSFGRLELAAALQRQRPSAEG